MVCGSPCRPILPVLTIPATCQPRGAAGVISAAQDWATWAATPATCCSARCICRNSGRRPPTAPKPIAASASKAPPPACTRKAIRARRASTITCPHAAISPQSNSPSRAASTCAPPTTKHTNPSNDLLHGEKAGSFGALLIGTEASIYTSDPWNRSSSLLPKAKSKELRQPEKNIPRVGSHHREWVDACKGKGKTFSGFEIGGPLTELIQLANVAGIIGEPFHYDPLSGEIKDHPAASQLLHREYRKGWPL